MNKMKDVKGIVWQDKNSSMYPTAITVRVTSDDNGKTLSLTDEGRGVQIIVPLEPLADMLEVVE